MASGSFCASEGGEFMRHSSLAGIVLSSIAQLVNILSFQPSCTQHIERRVLIECRFVAEEDFVAQEIVRTEYAQISMPWLNSILGRHSRGQQRPARFRPAILTQTTPRVMNYHFATSVVLSLQYSEMMSHRKNHERTGEFQDRNRNEKM